MEVKNCAYCGEKLNESIVINNIVFCSAKCSDESDSCDYLGILRRKAAAFDVLVRRRWFVRLDRGQYTVRNIPDIGEVLGIGATDLEAVENAERLWEKR